MRDVYSVFAHVSVSHLQHQTTANNTVVVTAQPVPQVHTVYRTGNSEYALPAIIFAVAITVCFLSLGCWYAIICSGIGIALAAAVSCYYKESPVSSLVSGMFVVLCTYTHNSVFPFRTVYRCWNETTTIFGLCVSVVS